MKYEIGVEKPAHLKEYWPGQYDVFSHFEYVTGIPQVLFLITTLKDNGNINVNFHSWSAFSGDSGGYFAIIAGLIRNSHTYRNIKRDGEFCVNFLNSSYYEACQMTVKHNGDEDDELAAAGLTAEPAVCVKPPRIKEAFISYECRFESETDLSGKGTMSMVIGRVIHASVDANHKDVDAVCSENSFMYYVHAPKDMKTGEGENGAIARLSFVRPE